MHVTDRSESIIKSGGEWISSIELENIATSHPDIEAAACIAFEHPNGVSGLSSLPVRREGTSVTAQQVLDLYDGTVARWLTPDDVVFVDELPITTTGKLQKLALRQRFGKHLIGN